LEIFLSKVKLKKRKAFLLKNKPQIVSLLSALQFLYGRQPQAEKTKTKKKNNDVLF